jgi:hypothetical protein
MFCYAEFMVHSSRASQIVLRTVAVLCSLALVLMIVRVAFTVENQTTASVTPYLDAFSPGETLTYDISWSRILSAGTAILEVKEEKLPDGREGLRFVVTGRSIGLLDKVYPVNDLVESVFDPQTRESLSFSLRESYGGKKRRRELVFDHARNIVVSRLNDDPVETLTVPEHVQDGLSMLYYLRAKDDFVVGKVFTIEVHNSKKNWSVEIHTLGRERLKTPMGEFATIKVKTYPKYRGMFINKGEVFIWLTDDRRRIPLLMKSKLAFGSFVFTLTDMTPEHFLEAPHQ